MTDEEALSLHDRAARGESLTDEETSHLESWYATQDAAEAGDLASAAIEPVNLTERIREALEQVASTARTIQRTMEANDSLRREIAGLRLSLSQDASRSG